MGEKGVWLGRYKKIAPEVESSECRSKAACVCLQRSLRVGKENLHVDDVEGLFSAGVSVSRLVLANRRTYSFQSWHVLERWQAVKIL